MTQEEKEEFKQILHDHVAGIVAINEAKNDIIIYKLDVLELNQGEIKKSVDFTNGKIGLAIKDINDLKIETELLKKQDEMNAIAGNTNLNNHVLNCVRGKDLDDRVDKLENENLTKKEMKKMLYQGLGVLSLVVGIIVAIQKIWFS